MTIARCPSPRCGHTLVPCIEAHGKVLFDLHWYEKGPAKGIARTLCIFAGMNVLPEYIVSATRERGEGRT